MYLSAVATPDRPAKRRELPQLAARFYGEADGIVAVSTGVADDLAAITDLDRRQIKVIYNPVVDEDFATRAAEPAPHPLAAQKDFTTLLRAFAALRARRPAR